MYYSSDNIFTVTSGHLPENFEVEGGFDTNRKVQDFPLIQSKKNTFTSG